MHGKKGTDVRTSSRTSYCLYDVRRRRVRDSDVLVDVQRLVRRFPSNAGAMGVFMRFKSMVLQLPGGVPVMGGDFNLTVNLEKDEQHGSKNVQGSYLREFADALGMVAVWRHHNPLQRQFCYSGDHGSY
ncbi:hypothetical protein NDU88_000295 [Pleurodeles waltl]|uniref:Uncharacterized protein n=1 Tax=Pleurodeles waltl TaxID=8319 RepID=A0AAV7PZS6_PLEWA|nr:hypothetical protein NDU88_000295 [Pleurodeles waltl]